MDGNDNEPDFGIDSAIAGQTHRINNTLQAINGGAHLVEMGLRKKDLATVANGWEIVSRNHVQIGQLVRNLVTASKPFEASREVCDPTQIVRQALDSQSRTLDLEQIELSTDLDEGLIASVDYQATQLLIEDLLSMVCRSVRGLNNRFCKIECVGRTEDFEIRFEYGGQPDREKADLTETQPLESEKSDTSPIEIEVAQRIVVGHGGTILFSSADEDIKNIVVTLPKG